MKKKILIVNVNWIGDILFSTPFIRAVREAYPDSHIACLLHPRCREMLESNTRLDEIIIYDEEGVHKSLMGKLKLILSLRKRHFDAAFILHRSFTKALITALAGIKERIGYPTKNRSFLLTTAVEEPLEETHKVEYFLNIARAEGIDARDTSYEFYITAPDRDFVKRFLRDIGVSDKDRLAAICPGGNWDPKRWPKENFARLADTMAERFGVKVVICGAAKDVALAEEIKKMMKDSPIIACGRTSLGQLAALFERMDIVVANDTGPMHLAVAAKAKVIALFGPTSSHITGPYGKGSYVTISRNERCEIPCYDFTCKDNSCMAAITVEDVLSEAEKMLAIDGARP
ncbi:MAG: lipopolysaccharide heptosyltransferase II [Candidatus Omnitrophota bacterium]